MRGLSPALIFGVAAACALAGCKREPTFDERYASAQGTLRRKAAELDKDMATRASDAAQDEPAVQPEEHPVGKI